MEIYSQMLILHSQTMPQSHHNIVLQKHGNIYSSAYNIQITN